MSLSFKERKKILKSINTLDLTPIKLYSDIENNDELVTVIVPKFKNKIVVKLVSPKLKSDHFKIKLDKFGSTVWSKINGKTKVDQIIKDLKKKFGDEIQEEHERTTKFIFQLYTQGFISFKELN
jgi:Coenzyme PQQ synthesis protein D (PqqD)